MIPLTQHSKNVEAESYQDVYDELVVRSRVRNNLLLDIVAKAAKPCVCFVKIVDHGKVLTKRLQNLGINTEFLWGSHSNYTRDENIKRLLRGDIDVIVASKILQQGVDMPEVLSVVNGAGMKSTIATLQRLGRGMRLAEGKTNFELWDVYDLGDRFMESHSKSRERSYRKEGHEVLLGFPESP
jgi:superfamily II DNA or RNA helicase